MRNNKKKTENNNNNRLNNKKVGFFRFRVYLSFNFRSNTFAGRNNSKCISKTNEKKRSYWNTVCFSRIPSIIIYVVEFFILFSLDFHFYIGILFQFTFFLFMLFSVRSFDRSLYKHLINEGENILSSTKKKKIYKIEKES